MTDPTLAFTLRIRAGNDPMIIIRAFDDAGWDHAGRVKLRVEVRQGGKVIFPKGALYCAGHFLSDGIEAKELVLSLVGMRPGDTDCEYFADYTPEQLAWAREYGESIAWEADLRYRDDNGRCAKSESQARAFRKARRNS